MLPRVTQSYATLYTAWRRPPYGRTPEGWRFSDKVQGVDSTTVARPEPPRSERAASPASRAGAFAWRICLLAAPALLLLFVLACNGGGSSDGTGGAQATPTPLPTPTPFPGVDSEVAVPNADFPVAMAFAPDGRLFYAERNTGNVRLVTADGRLQKQPVLHVDVIANPAMPWGLVGLALDPAFEQNGFIYVFYTAPVDERRAQPKLARYTVAANRASKATVLMDDLPEAKLFSEYYVGGNIRFGPDGNLYVPIGDFDSTSNAKDLTSARGKVLRLNPQDGAAAVGNPFVGQGDEDARIFAYGLLWPYDLSFRPRSGEMFLTERGVYFCCDELNLVRAGQNYGWGVTPDESVAPVYNFAYPGQKPDGSKVYPTGLEFVSNEAYPALGDSLLVCEGTTHYMRRLVLNASNKVGSDDVILGDCQLDIAADPNGVIYYSNETEIRRLVSR